MGRPTLVSPAATREQIIDEYGEVDRQLRLWEPQMNPHQARHDELEARILAWATNEPADQETVVSGRAYQVEITARGLKSQFTREVKIKAYKLLKKVPNLDLMQFVSIPLGDLKAHLGKGFIEANIPKLRTGGRTVNVVPRMEAVPCTKRAA
jgi:hypothetical protein